MNEQQQQEHHHQSQQNSWNNNGIAAFLDLPIGSAICLDAGVVEIILKRDDFIGLYQLPSQGFHLITVRAAAPPASRTAQQQQHQQSHFAATTVGFVLPTTSTTTTIIQPGSDTDAIATPNVNPAATTATTTAALVRRYDPQTEEVAATPPDDLTVSNLVQQIQTGRIYPLERLLAYPQVVASSTSSSHSASPSSSSLSSTLPSGMDRATTWQRHLSNFISPRLLERRGIQPGVTKIVPGTFEDWLDHETATASNSSSSLSSPHHPSAVATTPTTTAAPAIVDGTSISYPGIPVVMDRHFQQPSRHQHQHHRLVNHVGTKRFLSTLTPTQRTQLLTSSNIPANMLLRQILAQYYNDVWQDLLGDVQLSYTIFLQLRCYASLEHWRDLVAMLSCVSVELFLVKKNHGHFHYDYNKNGEDVVDIDMIRLYTALLQVLSSQVRSTMENDFFDNDDFSGGNFFGPCNQRLLTLLKAVIARVNVSFSNKAIGKHCNDIISELARSVESYRALLQHRLPALFLTTEENDYGSGNNNCASQGLDSSQQDDNLVEMMDVNEHYGSDDDGDDGPVVVSSEEVQASLERMQQQAQQQRARTSTSKCVTISSSIPQWHHQRHHQEQYPILFAAIMPHEDVLMTCARALDQASDVSLVREAAAYLEQVEAQRQGTAVAPDENQIVSVVNDSADA